MDNSLPDISPTDNSPQGTSPPTLFRFVARFARVRIGDSSRNRFASTAYFAQSQTTLFSCILFMRWMFRGGTTGVEHSGSNFLGGNIPVTTFSVSAWILHLRYLVQQSSIFLICALITPRKRNSCNICPLIITMDIARERIVSIIAFYNLLYLNEHNSI